MLLGDTFSFGVRSCNKGNIVEQCTLKEGIFKLVMAIINFHNNDHNQLPRFKLTSTCKTLHHTSNIKVGVEQLEMSSLVLKPCISTFKFQYSAPFYKVNVVQSPNICIASCTLWGVESSQSFEIWVYHFLDSKIFIVNFAQCFRLCFIHFSFKFTINYVVYVHFVDFIEILNSTFTIDSIECQ
jgi:hypothetical protein